MSNLREQTNKIKIMAESGHYDNIFLGNTLADKGMFSLSETHDICIVYTKWYNLSANMVFVNVLNFVTILSSLVLAFDNPFSSDDSLRNRILLGFDLFFTTIFIAEAILKIVALGFCKTSLSGKNRKAYLADPWNRLDFLLVIVQIIDLFKKQIFDPSGKSQLLIEGLKALKAMRALRPLRMIHRFKVLRVAMNTIVNSGQ